MALTKRKRSFEESEDEDTASSIISGQSSDNDEDDGVDITSALTRQSIQAPNDNTEGDGDDYEELEALIKDSVARRDKKEGTKLLKQAKGKTKLGKGEVGGGSFQAMGNVYTILFRLSTPT